MESIFSVSTLLKNIWCYLTKEEITELRGDLELLTKEELIEILIDKEKEQASMDQQASKKGLDRSGDLG
jgi:hypothetical protein